MAYELTPGGYTLLEQRTAVSAGLDVQQAVQYLRQDARIRTVRETLARCIGMEDADRSELKDAVVSLLMRGNPGAKRDSVDKNVRNWLSDGTQAISKGYAIQLAYALRMPIEQAEVWLTRLCGEAFHWRDPEDIVWGFGLINGLDYAQADGLRERLKARGLLDIPSQQDEDAMTSTVRQEAAQLRTEADLEAFLSEARGRLGSLHNTAYRMFCDFMDLLQAAGDHSPASMPRTAREGKRPAANSRDDLIPQDEDMSVRDVLVTYLYNEYIPRACRRGRKDAAVGSAVLSALQRSIQKNWPDETTLSKMKERKTDVTRKVLILLFLATDGGEGEYADWEDIDADESFESMETRLNLMLADCGFARLDSRAPFDWMVLYCMYADESIFLESHMRLFLEGIFAGPEPTVPEAPQPAPESVFKKRGDGAL